MNGFIQSDKIVGAVIIQDIDTDEWKLKVFTIGGFSFTVFRGEKQDAEIKLKEIYLKTPEGVIEW